MSVIIRDSVLFCMALARCEESILWLLWSAFLDTDHIFLWFLFFSLWSSLLKLWCIFNDFDLFFLCSLVASVIFMCIFSVYALFLFIYICSLMPWVSWVLLSLKTCSQSFKFTFRFVVWKTLSLYLCNMFLFQNDSHYFSVWPLCLNTLQC